MLIPFRGISQTTLNPNWWGLDSSVQLQLQIVKHGDNQFMSSTVVGPVWTATYDSSAAGAAKPSSETPSIAQRVKNIFHNLSGGQIAAAVILPLLAIAGIVALFYIRQQRKKAEQKTHRFSKAIDQRMSTISTDWRSMSGAGANAAIRKSMAMRDSIVGDGERPGSMFNQAGIGAIRTSEEKVPQMEEMAYSRASVFESGERISRISFAPDTRLSTYSEKENPRLPSAIRGLNARSFHQGHTSLDDDRPEDVNRDLNMSPTQTAGPNILHPGEIVARASTENDAAFQREVLQMPAMTLMRTGGAPDSEFVLPPVSSAPAAATPTYGDPLPALPSPAFQPNTPTTPMTGLMPAMNSPTGPGLSPDALLRAYAAGRPLASPATPANGGMRMLYQNEPTTPVTPQYPQIQQFPASPTISNSTTLAPADNNPFRKSMAGRGSMYTESMYSAGAYDDEAAYDTSGHHAYEHDGGHAYGHAQ